MAINDKRIDEFPSDAAPASNKLVLIQDPSTLQYSKATLASIGAGSGGGTGVTDGNKGDITVSNSGATWTVNSGTSASKIGSGNVDNTEFGYLDGVTGPIQSQLAGKQNTVALTTTGTSGAATFNPTTGALNIPNYATGGGGDMTKAVYDTNNDGVVDNSQALGGQSSAYHLSRTNHTGTQLAATISDLSKSSVGLGNVDNTSDVNKPVSTATQNALNTKVTDLTDLSVGTAGTLSAGFNSQVTASGTYTAPTPSGTLTTPPQRFAITNRTTGAVTLSFPNPAGTTVNLSILPGEVLTMRQVSTGGYINESGNKPLAQLDARYLLKTGDTSTGTQNIALNGVTPNTFVNSPINAAGSVNDTLQLNIQNQNSGTSASSDLIATANTGTDSANYIDMGINSSTYADTGFTIGGALDGYLYNNGGNLAVGTQSTGKVIKFHTGGTLAANERVQINDSGIKLPSGTAGHVLTAAAGGQLSLQAPAGVSPLTTKGDIYTYSTTNARLPVGSNGQIIYADSTQATGLRWDAAPSAGGTTVNYAQPVYTEQFTYAASNVFTIANSPVSILQVTVNGKVLDNNEFSNTTTAVTVTPSGYTFVSGDIVRIQYLAVTTYSSTGGFSANVSTKTASYTLVASDYTVVFNSASATTATLPTAVGNTGRIFNIKQLGAGQVSLATTSSQTIDGMTAAAFNTAQPSTQYRNLTFQSDGANWVVI